MQPCIRLLPALSVTPWKRGVTGGARLTGYVDRPVREQHWGIGRIFCIIGQESCAVKLNDQTFDLPSILCRVEVVVYSFWDYVASYLTLSPNKNDVMDKSAKFSIHFLAINANVFKILSSYNICTWKLCYD